MTVHGRVKADGSWDPGSFDRVPADEAWKLRTSPPQPDAPEGQARVYSRLLAWLWGQPVVPTAVAVADSGLLAGLPGGAELAGRLRAWPAGEAYPPIPDDRELEARITPGSQAGVRRARWWTPGDRLGGISHAGVMRAKLLAGARRP